MTVFEFIVLALATYRISSLIAGEDGPFDILQRLRVLVGMRYDTHGKPYASNGFAEGVMCVWCNSLWVGLGVTAAFNGWASLTLLVALPFAFSAVAVSFHQMNEK